MVIKNRYLAFLLLLFLNYQGNGQSHIATTQSENAIINHNQRKLVRDSNDNMYVAFIDIEENINIIRFVSYDLLSDSWELSDQFLYGKNPSLAISRENEIHLVYESNDSLNTILYSRMQQSGEWSSSIIISDSIHKNILPVADIDSASVTHIVWIKDGIDVDVVKYTNIKGDIISEVQTLYTDTIITDITIATDLHYHNNDVFVSYSTNNEIHFQYSKDYGDNWELFGPYIGSHPCISVGFYPIPYEHKDSYLQPKLFYLDNVDNAVLMQYGDTLSGQYTEVNSNPLLVVESPVDELHIDDVILPHGFGFIFAKDGHICEAFAYMELTNGLWVNDTLPEDAFNPNVAYKSFRPFTVDYLWMEDNGSGYNIFCKETQKFPNAIEPQNNIHGDILTAYPNPFKSFITIHIELENRIVKPEVWIYSIKGQLIKKLKVSDQDNNSNLVYVWDGRHSNGKMVSSGLYVVHATSEDIDIYRTIICNK
jgi:hypothetical protein